VALYAALFNKDRKTCDSNGISAVVETLAARVGDLTAKPSPNGEIQPGDLTAKPSPNGEIQPVPDTIV
jgi:hypothetical protein